MAIPKNISLIWLQGFENLPEKFLPNIKSITEKNPNWKIYKWDENSIRQELKNLGQEYLDKYNSFQLLHQKVDYARFTLAYIYGGAFLDTDVVAIRSLDETPHLNDEDDILILSEKPHSKQMNNATILVTPKNTIIKYLIDNIDTTPCGDYESNYQCIQRTTGPYAFHRLLKNFKDQIIVLDKKYFEPCASLDDYCEIDPNLTILDHRHELSWLNPRHKNLIKLYFEAKHYKVQILFGLVIIILLILILRKNN